MRLFAGTLRLFRQCLLHQIRKFDQTLPWMILQHAAILKEGSDPVCIQLVFPGLLQIFRCSQLDVFAHLNPCSLSPDSILTH